MNLLGSSLFTGALTGLQSSYFLLANGAKSLSMEDILNPGNDTV